MTPAGMRLRGAALAGDTVIGDQPDGVFQLASVGKQLVASAVLMLVRDGRLDLREPVARWLPDGLPQWKAANGGCYGCRVSRGRW